MCFSEKTGKEGLIRARDVSLGNGNKRCIGTHVRTQRRFLVVQFFAVLHDFPRNCKSVLSVSRRVSLPESFCVQT